MDDFERSGESEPQIVKFHEKIDHAVINSKEEFWSLVQDLSIYHSSQSRAAIAEAVMLRRMDLPSVLADEVENERVELARYDLVVSDLNQMPLIDESEYRRMLDHLSKSRKISPSLVRQAMLVECRLDRDLREFIKSEEYSKPRAFINDSKVEMSASSEIAVENNEQKGEEDIPVPKIESKGTITSSMIERLASYMQATEFQLENEILERFDAAIQKAKGIYLNEARNAGKEGYAFVQEVIKGLDEFKPSEHSELVNAIAQNVLIEVEHPHKNGEPLRSKEYEKNDKVMNVVGLYIALALFEQMKP